MTGSMSVSPKAGWQLGDDVASVRSAQPEVRYVRTVRAVRLGDAPDLRSGSSTDMRSPW